MMSYKIPLIKSRSLGYERDTVSFSIKYGSLPSLYDTAIVDTGCPYFIISQNAIKKTRIPYGGKPAFEKPINIGGMFFNLYSLGVCDLCFRDIEKKEIKFKHIIYVGIPTLSKNELLTKQIPSFVGKDLLDDNFISIIKSKKGNYLQQIDD